MVEGATDVVIGGPAVPDCVDLGRPDERYRDPVSVISLQGGYGIDLVDTIDATVSGFYGDTIFGGVLEVRGGEGTHLHSNYTSLGRLGTRPDGSPTGFNVRIDGAGTEANPVRYEGGESYFCLSHCLEIVGGSHVEVGSDDLVTTIRRAYADDAVVRIAGSTVHARNVELSSILRTGLEIVDGASDVTFEDSSFRYAVKADRSAHAVRVGGSPPPSGVVLRGNAIGNAASGFVDIDNGIEVTAAAGITIEDNDVLVNGQGITIRGPGPEGVVVRGNRIGVLEGQRADTAVSVLDTTAVQVLDNDVAGTTADGIRVLGASSGTVVAGNSLRSIGGDGIHVEAPDVEVEANTVDGALSAGIAALGLDGRVRGNEVTGSVRGIDVAGDGTFVGPGNVVTGTTGSSEAVVVRAMGVTITGNSIHHNVGDGIDLQTVVLVPANGGIEPPSVGTAVAGGDVTTVTGSVTDADGPWTVEVYASAACGRNDHEGELSLGTFTTASPAFEGEADVPPTGLEQLTMTVTDDDGETSEFSSCLTVERVTAEEPTPTTPSTPTTAGPTPTTLAGTTSTSISNATSTTTAGPSSTLAAGAAVGAGGTGRGSGSSGTGGALARTGAPSTALLAGGLSLVAAGLLARRGAKRA